MCTEDPDAFYRDHAADGPLTPRDFGRLFEVLWETHAGTVFAHAYARLQNPHDAAEIRGEAFVRVMQSVQGRPAPSRVNFAGLLHLTTRRLVIDLVRSRRRSRAWPRRRDSAGDGEDRPVEMPDPDAPRPLEEVSRRERVEVTRRCIERLEEAKRQVLLLRHFDGLTYEEIAREVGMPPKTVGTVLFRARREVRRCVEAHLAA